MITKYVLNRGCLRWNRPRLLKFLIDTFYPNMAVTTTAALYPTSAGKITTIKGTVSQYGTDHGLHHTVAANGDWNDLKNEVADLFDDIDDVAANDQAKLELTGVAISIPAGHGSKDPQTGKVTNVKIIAEGGLKFRAEYEADDFAHQFRGRTRIKGLVPVAPWFYEGISQNHTMYFTGMQYPRGTEVEAEIMASGTQGDANEWSDEESELVK